MAMFCRGFSLTSGRIFNQTAGNRVLPKGRCFTRCQVLLQQGSTNSAQDTERPTICTESSGIRIITLNNPKKRNALSSAMLESLKYDLETYSPDLRVIIIRGNGPVFSAGHDLSELTSIGGSPKHMEIFQKCTEVMSMVQDVSVPVIAEVNGVATAAGCQLVATCDLAIASDISTFATPGVSVGLFCSTPGIALARAVPRKLALEMLFTGQSISAEVALRNGLVNKVVPEDKLKEEVMTIALRICEMSGPVIALGKQFFYQQVTMDRNRAYKNGEVTMVENLRMADAQEGIDAFLKKRKPEWVHTEEKVH